jgi:hypothetical protein
VPTPTSSAHHSYHTPLDIGTATSQALEDRLTDLDFAILNRQANLDAEVSRATGAEGILTSGISGAVATANAGISLLTTNLTAEATARAAADTTESTARAAADTTEATTRAAAVSAEASARIAGDATVTTAFQTADASEAATRAAADSTEVTARVAGDAAVTAAFQAADTTEATARAAGDNALTAAFQAADTTEIAMRTAADVALGLRIDPLEVTASTSGGTGVTTLTRTAAAAQILNIGGDGTTVTVNFASPHPFVDGDFLSISGCVVTTAYNGATGAINKISTTQIAFLKAVNAATETPASGYARTIGLFVASTTPFLANQQISVTSDTGDLHTTTVNGSPAGGVVQLAAAVPTTWTGSNKASSGATVSSTLEEVRLSRGTYVSLMHRLAGIDALPGAARLSAAPAVGATSVSLRTAPPAALQNTGYFIIDPFTVECEIRKAGVISGTSVAISALTYAHAVDDPVLWQSAARFDVALFGAVGDGTTNDAAAIQAAHDAMPTAGGTLVFSDGQYICASALTFSKKVIIQGVGWKTLVNTTFGSSQWTAANAVLGTVLKFTNAAADGITFNGTNQRNVVMRDIALVGPGSGTTSGINLNPSSNSGRNRFHNVFVCNFYNGWRLTASEDNTFYNIFAHGCTNGIFPTGTVTNNRYFDVDVQSNTNGIVSDAGSHQIFYGGLVQNNTNGLLLKPAAIGGVDVWEFDGFWLENNTTDIACDSTAGPLTHMHFSNCRSSNAAAFSFTGTRAFNSFSYRDNRFLSATLTLPAQAAGTVLINPGLQGLTDGGSGTIVIDKDRGVNLSNITGLSATTSPAKNFNGSATITDAATSATVTFGTAEASSAYHLALAVESKTGTPATASLRAFISSKASGSFIINLEAAPGVGSSVVVHWILSR